MFYKDGRESENGGEGFGQFHKSPFLSDDGEAKKPACC